MPEHDELLKRIRRRFEYMKVRWQKIRDEARKDMLYNAGDPWPENEKKARKDKRPMLVCDEFGQYTNQTINTARMNRVDIQVDPRGDEATDETARLKADHIRQIEYKSNAQQAHILALTGAVERSYGFSEIVKVRTDKGSFDQDLRIVPIQNPEVIWIDPDYEQADASDIQDAFKVWRIDQEVFKKKWPDATVTDFTPDMAPAWIGMEDLQIAKYWYVEKSTRTLLALPGPAGETVIYLDEIPGAKIKGQQLVGEDGTRTEILKQDKEDQLRVFWCITNGVEILEGPTEWEDEEIPINCCFGKEMYVDYGNGPERVLLSQIRLARDPAMLLNYCRTSQMELAGSAPKVPWLGYVGQFDAAKNDWQGAAKFPLTYLEAQAYTDEYPEGPPLPLPSKASFEPAIQALEILAESARRAIQAAMGISNLPTSAQRQNQKSGVALEKIRDMEQQGAFHFIDNYHNYLAVCGRRMDRLISKVVDTERDVGMRGRDGKHYVVRANTNAPITGPDGQRMHYVTGQGKHDVTIKAGQSFDSERDQADQFVDQVATPEMMVAAIQGNPKASKIVGQAIRLRNGGPIMDSIADVVDPKDQVDDPAEENAKLKEQVAKAQQIIQELKPLADKEQAALMRTKLEKAAELDKADRDNKTKKEIAAASDRTEIIKALIAAQQTGNMALLDHQVDMIHKEMELEREADALLSQQAHTTGENEAARQAAMEQQDQSHQQALEQQQQAAELAPEPAAE